MKPGLLVAAAIFALASFAPTRPVLAQGANHGEIGSLPVLLSIPEVRSDLAITRAQSRQIDAIKSSYQKSLKILAQGVDASSHERAEALRRETNEQALQVLNATQRRRLPAIERRALGATLLYSPAIRKELGLNASQDRRIEQIRTAALRQQDKINRQYELGRIDSARRLEMLRSDRLWRAEKLWDVLSPPQRRAFWAPLAADRRA